MNTYSAINFALGLILAPFMFGVINRTKAKFGGRQGQPLLQPYYDIFKLLGKGAVYSKTTTWVFRAGPMIGLTVGIVGLLIVPMGGTAGLLAFPGDLLLLVYLYGLMRFFTVLAALDTGSPFEGMGASREASWAALAEPALLLGLATLAVQTKSLSLSGILTGLNLETLLSPGGISILLVAAAFCIVFLVENSRIPFDDPTTHLELTMIHEVMVLDHSGPDLAFIEYSSALKMWTLGLILTGIFSPVSAHPLVMSGVSLALLFALAVAVGVVESVMARLKLPYVPLMLVSATVLSLLAITLALFTYTPRI
jgi:formate hydrogenlyase subunit 4